MMKATSPTPTKPPIYVVKARPALMAQIVGRIASIIPAAFEPPPAPNTRILLREFDGGATGRFDIVRFVCADAGAWRVERTWSRSQGGQDDADLRFVITLGYEPKIVEGVILGASE